MQPTHKLLAPTSEAPFGSLLKIIHPPVDYEMYSPEHYKHEAMLKKNVPYALTSELKGVKVGDLVMEGKEFEIEYMFQLPFFKDDEWKITDSREYYLCHDSSIKKRIVAIPLEKEKIDTPPKGIEGTPGNMFPEISEDEYWAIRGLMYIVDSGKSFNDQMKEIHSKFLVTRK